MKRAFLFIAAGLVLATVSIAQPTAPSVEIVQPEEWETVSTESIARLVYQFESPKPGDVIICGLHLVDYDGDDYPYCRKDFTFTPVQTKGPGGWKLEFALWPTTPPCAEPDVVDLEIVRPEEGDLVSWKQVSLRAYMKLPPSVGSWHASLHAFCDTEGTGWNIEDQKLFYVAE